MVQERLGLTSKLEATVRYLLSRGAKIDSPCEDGWTALHSASDFGNVSLVKLLCDHGADLNSIEATEKADRAERARLAKAKRANRDAERKRKMAEAVKRANRDAEDAKKG